MEIMTCGWPEGDCPLNGGSVFQKPLKCEIHTTVYLITNNHMAMNLELSSLSTSRELS